MSTAIRAQGDAALENLKALAAALRGAEGRLGRLVFALSTAVAAALAAKALAVVGASAPMDKRALVAVFAVAALDVVAAQCRSLRGETDRDNGRAAKGAAVLAAAAAALAAAIFPLA